MSFRSFPPGRLPKDFREPASIADLPGSAGNPGGIAPATSLLGRHQAACSTTMSKPQHKVKKANHGKRPANSQERKRKRQIVRT
jgi:hypothetical protein